MEAVKHIKLRLPGESFWAIPLSENTAEIGNILLDDEYSLGDIVMHDSDGNVTMLLKKVSNTAILTYAFNPLNRQQAIVDVKTIVEWFEVQNGIKTEPGVPGMIMIAVPIGILREQVVEIAGKCPVKVELRFMDEEEEEEV